jgi:hypothetical protein
MDTSAKNHSKDPIKGGWLVPTQTLRKQVVTVSDPNAVGLMYLFSVSTLAKQEEPAAS